LLAELVLRSRLAPSASWVDQRSLTGVRTSALTAVSCDFST
jgi:hypothetical protein